MDTDPATEKLISNERVKLSATYANGLSIAIFAVGGFAPFISAALSQPSSYAPVLLIMVVCWIMSGTIHWAARTALRDLRA